MKILVTGALGFIGSNLTIDLLNAGHTVIGVDNLSKPSLNPTDRIKAATGDNWPRFKFFKKDIRDYDGFYEVLLHEKPDSIVHLAALGSVPYSFQQPIDFYEVNCAGFATVLQTARDIGIRRIVYASSSSVYGNATSDDGKRLEGKEGMPISPYAISKVQNELHAMVWGSANKMELIGLRFFNVYGPGQRYDTKFCAVIPQWINSPKMRICGNSVRDYTYVSDVSDAIQLALKCESSGFVLNVGTGIGTSLKELSYLINTDDDRQIEESPARVGDVPISIAGTVKAQMRLGFEAKVSLKEGIRKTMESYHG